ncbi:MAG: EamA/RhaT family transporter, partial [Hyphomicrobiales bacterium]|nr:EamA/RhaT family transporter [Hyphomicrobiales bacterium]
MSELAPQPPVVQPRALEGIGCIMLGMMLFVVQDGMMKSLLGTYPIWLLIVARGVVSILILGPAILYLGHPHRLLSPLWPLHLLRAALFTIGFSMFYTAFPFMGLAEVST